MVSYGTNAYLTVNNGLMFMVRNVKLMVRNGIFGYYMANEHFDYPKFVVFYPEKSLI